MTRFPTARIPTAALGLALAAALWTPVAAQPQPDLGTDQQRAAGKMVYDKWCAQCHGDTGAGDGIAALRLVPRPRDFTEGKYKIRTTPNGMLPTDADVARVIVEGIPGTAMPGFPELGEVAVTNLVQYLKTFAPDWEDPQAYAEPFDLPSPPAFSEGSLETGFAAYQEIGCAPCHGELGRGDGATAPTLRDDWGNFIRPANLTMPWTFRAGGSREAIFKTLTTGFNGTPMAGFVDGLTEEQRWQIVDWITAQARKTGSQDGRTAPYTDLARAVGTTADLDFAQGLDALREAFADAPAAMFPVIGQIMEPGRAFHPSAVAITLRVVYNTEDVAFMLTWHDMRAETSGRNAPDEDVPLEDELLGLPMADLGTPAGAAGGDAAADASDGEPETDIWGNPVGPAPGAGRPEPTREETTPSADLWGMGGGSPGAQAVAAANTGPVPDTPWSDAVALQWPVELREGIAKPYFLLGDPSYPVHLWHVDLAQGDEATVWEGRGSEALVRAEAEAPEVLSGYDRGEWTVVFKRPRRGVPGVAFESGEFIPVAFSVWDGFAHERGSKRGLTRWFHVYLEPMEAPPVWGPVMKTFLTVLLLELLIIGIVRWRSRRGRVTPEPTHRPPVTGTPVEAE